MFRRMVKRGGGASVDVDAQVRAGIIRAGDTFPGQVVLGAADRDVEIETLSLVILANLRDDYSGESRSDEIARVYLDGPFVVRKGQQIQLPFSARLPWETPVTELEGRALGALVELRTLIDHDDPEDGADHDLIHVQPLPLHEAILDAFAAEGFVCQSAELVDERLPNADQLFDFHQSFVLADRVGAAGGPGDLEVTFLTNAVGCEVFVRPVTLRERDQYERTPARRFVSAHHDLDRVDWSTEVRQWIDEVALLAR